MRSFYCHSLSAFILKEKYFYSDGGILIVRENYYIIVIVISKRDPYDFMREQLKYKN